MGIRVGGGDRGWVGDRGGGIEGRDIGWGQG